jgi:NAD-dependent deacetylase
MSRFSPDLVRLLRSVARAAALTGAGISQESGLPTFREAGSGLWAQFRPEDLATSEAFERNPQLVWEWYSARRLKAGEVFPNAGHYALVEIEQHIPDFTLITQNVDGLHQRAGSQRVIELHGNITRVRCSVCGMRYEEWEQPPQGVPSCPRCGAKLRPDVVWFGEMLPPRELSRAIEAAQSCQVFFSLGTSGVVEPAASLPRLARRHGAVLVEVNLNPTPLTPSVDYFLQGKAGEILPALVKETWGGEDRNGEA